MKNREYKKLLAVALMVAMVGSMTGTATLQTKAANTTESTTESSVTDTIDSKLSELLSSDSDEDDSAKPTKAETVYAKIDETGSVKNVTVSDQLKNITDQTKVEDKSSLSDIQNLKGDEEFNQSSDSLTWTGDGKDIVYSGTANASDLPVGVEITYTLDGKELKASELEGKSGHLVIRYDYKNLSQAKTGSFVPFLMATGIVVDGDVFTNVTTTNAKMASDGDRDLVIGYGFPGVAQELATDIDIPDYFEMEADVTDYTAPQSVTFGTNDVFNEIDTDGIDSIDDLQDSMNQLSDASNELVDGTGQLKDGLNQLLDKSGELVDGVDQLATGGTKLANGTEQLADATEALTSKTGELASGASSAEAQTSGKLVTGATNLDAGVDLLQSQLGRLGTLSQSVTALNAGTEKLAAGAAALDTGVQKAAQGATLVSGGIDKISVTATKLNNGLQLASASTSELAEKAGTLADNLADQTKEVTTSDQDITVQGVSDAKNNLATAAAKAREDGDEELAGTIEEIAGNLTESVHVNGEKQTVTVDNSEYIAEAREIQEALNGTARTLGIAGDDTTLGDAANGIDNGINKSKTEGVPSLKDGAANLAQTLNSADEDQIGGGAAALNAGLNTSASSTDLCLKDGMNALDEAINGTGKDDGMVDTLPTGVEQLKDGTTELKNGVNKLSIGLKTISDGTTLLYSKTALLNVKMNEADGGAKTLSNGINTLQSKTPTLTSGITQLNDGATTLNSGMIEFDETGIQKLTSAFDGDIDGLFDKLNTMLDSSKSYKNFSGLSDKMEGSVKFVFVTDSESK